LVHRIAVVFKDQCQPKKCNLECISFCPVNKTGKDCIVLGENGKARIGEALCTGCGICIKKCPFKAITIVNLPEELVKEKVHQYDVNGFRLYRLPIPRFGSVVGLVGKNGTGKSTAINILSGQLRPNLGKLDGQPSDEEILEGFQGTELRAYYEKVLKREIKVSVKPQAVYLLPRFWKGDVLSLLKMVDERGELQEAIRQLNLEESLSRKVEELSGGELQRVAIAVACLKEADAYFFDEPSSYNDVYQRLAVAKMIRKIAERGKAVILVEHDLTLLDYLSDYVHILYGEPGTYGIVSYMMSARAGVNALLDGYLPTENVRIRPNSVTFEIYSPQRQEFEVRSTVEYTKIVKRYSSFELRVSEGSLGKGEVIGILGANALGKTTFAKVLANIEKPDEGQILANVKISYKPQYLSANQDIKVKEVLRTAGGLRLYSSLIQSEIIKPLRIDRLYDKSLKNLSGGELQRVAIATCLLRDADVYLLDEPSAFIDVEDRIQLAKTIPRYIKAQGRSAIIIDHDIQLVDIVSDKLIVFSGKPGIKGEATAPLSKEKGMNRFLKSLEITYRREKETGRPRVNKLGSKLDRLQKEKGTYYYVEVFGESKG
jgi:ATP-binding cassette subfamily E protein 1